MARGTQWTIRRGSVSLSARERARLSRRLPELIESAQHCLRLAAVTASRDPEAALIHLGFAQNYLRRSLNPPRRRAG
jgi:hypothetical protein